jgi:hypothetical protein
LSPVEAAKELRRAFKINNCLQHPSIITTVSSVYCKTGKSLLYWRGIERFKSP